MKTYIINPDNGKKTTIEEWRKEADPTRATVLAIETDDGHLLLISKSYLPCGEVKWEEAQKACAAFTPEGLKGITFRAPTRKETLDIYDARFQGLDEAIALTGGNYAHNPDRNWYWTSEKDSDPKYAYGAWCSVGGSGCMYYSVVFNAILALPVTLLT